MADKKEAKESTAADRGTMEDIGSSGNSSKKNKLIGFLVLAAIAAGGIYISNAISHRKAPAPEEDHTQLSSVDRTANLNTQERPQETSQSSLGDIGEHDDGEQVTMGQLIGSQSANAAPQEDEILQRRMSSGFGLDGNQDTANANTEDDDTPKFRTTNDVINHRDPNSRDIDYDGQGVALVSASRIKNRQMVLTQGTKIPCTLETALDSTVPGLTTCIINHDVYSSDGTVRLIDRGSKLNGEYQSNLRLGQVRIGILWRRLETPDGVIINLASPATDTLGRAGVSGKVDTHFWMRFGHAIMLSMISDAFQYMDNKRDTRDFEDTEQSMQDLAQTALENEINIPPTIYKNQGEPIMVMLNRDLSFANVYKLKNGARDKTDPFLKDLHGYLQK